MPIAGIQIHKRIIPFPAALSFRTVVCFQKIACIIDFPPDLHRLPAWDQIMEKRRSAIRRIPAHQKPDLIFARGKFPDREMQFRFALPHQYAALGILPIFIKRFSIADDLCLIRTDEPDIRSPDQREFAYGTVIFNHHSAKNRFFEFFRRDNQFSILDFSRERTECADFRISGNASQGKGFRFARLNCCQLTFVARDHTGMESSGNLHRSTILAVLNADIRGS